MRNFVFFKKYGLLFITAGVIAAYSGGIATVHKTVKDSFLRGIILGSTIPQTEPECLAAGMKWCPSSASSPSSCVPQDMSCPAAGSTASDSPPVITTFVKSANELHPSTIYAGLRAYISVSVTDDNGIASASFNAPGMKYSSADVSLYQCAGNVKSCSEPVYIIVPSKPGEYTVTVKAVDSAGQTATQIAAFTAQGCVINSECGGTYFPSSGATFCGQQGTSVFNKIMKYQVVSVCASGTCDEKTEPGVLQDCGAGNVCTLSNTAICISQAPACAINAAIASLCQCGAETITPGFYQYYCCNSNPDNPQSNYFIQGGAPCPQVQPSPTPVVSSPASSQPQSPSPATRTEPECFAAGMKWCPSSASSPSSCIVQGASCPTTNSSAQPSSPPPVSAPSAVPVSDVPASPSNVSSAPSPAFSPAPSPALSAIPCPDGTQAPWGTPCPQKKGCPSGSALSSTGQCIFQDPSITQPKPEISQEEKFREERVLEERFFAERREVLQDLRALERLVQRDILEVDGKLLQAYKDKLLSLEPQGEDYSVLQNYKEQISEIRSGIQPSETWASADAKAEAQALRQLKEGVRKWESFIGVLEAKISGVEKAGITVETDMKDFLSGSKILAQKVKSAKNYDDIRDISEDIPDRGQALNDALPRIEKLSRLPRAFRLLERRFTDAQRSVQQAEASAKRLKLDAADEIESMMQLLNGAKDTLLTIKTSGIADELSDTLDEEVLGPMEDIFEMSASIRTVGAAKVAASRASSDVKRYESRIRRLQKKGEDMQMALALLEQFKKQLEGLKELSTKKLTPEIGDKIIELFGFMTDIREELENTLGLLKPDADSVLLERFISTPLEKISPFDMKNLEKGVL